MTGETNKVNNVRTFLRDLDLENYYEKIIEEGYDKLDDLQNLDLNELLDMGLKKGHAKQLLYEANRTLRTCKCKGAQYCNNTCYHAHWKEHKPEHNRLVQLLSSTGETKEEPTEDNKTTTDENKSKTKKQKPNDRCACGSKKKYKKCCGSKKR